MGAGSGEPKLPPTAYAVLGMLSFGREMSGYDLQKATESSVRFFWSPAKSQIYAELRRLQEAGYATEREVAQTDRPDKRLYAVTPAGRTAVERWLAESPVELETIRSTFLLKVFFAHLMAPGVVEKQMAEYREQMGSLLETFLEIERHILAADNPTPYPYMTLKFGIGYARSAIDWCDRTMKELPTGRERGRKKGGKR